MTGDEDVFNMAYEVFVGEWVEATTNVLLTGTLETEEGHIQVDEPIAAAGFLNDMDDQFLYFGQVPGQISKALRRDTVVHIEITQPPDESQGILKKLPVPSDPKDIN